jgi:hypothetical protein
LLIVYTVAGKAIGFALEQPLHVVTLACPASGILKRLEYMKARHNNKISIFLRPVRDEMLVENNVKNILRPVWDAM